MASEQSSPKELISILRVDLLDGTFYDPSKKYLEQKECIWDEKREVDQLVSISLAFPPGTVYEKKGDNLFLITLPSGAVINWTKVWNGCGGYCNSISIPYAHLPL